MKEAFLKIVKDQQLRSKIIFVLLMFVVFRLLAAIPVPGVDVMKLQAFFAQNQLFGLINVFTGSAMNNMSLVMLGLGPFITATIIMQLFTMLSPKLKALYQEEGERGRQKFNQYARLITFPLALLQGFGMFSLLKSQGIILPSVNTLTMVTMLITVAAGATFLMWIGELITEKGIGNGVSLLIFAGIVSRLPAGVQQAIINYSPAQLMNYALFLLVGLVVIAGVVIGTEGERKLAVSYAKRIRGNRIYGGVSTFLPIKVNQGGMIPIIFALSVMLFPSMTANFFINSKIQWLAHLATFMSGLVQNQLLYGIVYFILVILFTFFYTAVTFDPHAIAENLQAQGGFIPGIRPGANTVKYLEYILYRIVLVGALFLGIIAVIPVIMQGVTGNTNFTIGGTAILIVVAVVLETYKQIKAQVIMRDYAL